MRSDIEELKFITEEINGLWLPKEFDEAVIGLANRINLNDVVAYNKDKVIDIIYHQTVLDEEDLKLSAEEQDSRRYEMAVEHFEFNVIGGWVGEQTPIFIDLNECM
jgi:hypothetical protein